MAASGLHEGSSPAQYVQVIDGLTQTLRVLQEEFDKLKGERKDGGDRKKSVTEYKSFSLINLSTAETSRRLAISSLSYSNFYKRSTTTSSSSTGSRSWRKSRSSRT